MHIIMHTIVYSTFKVCSYKRTHLLHQLAVDISIIIGTSIEMGHEGIVIVVATVLLLTGIKVLVLSI